MNQEARNSAKPLGIVALALALMPLAANADGGFYIGVGVGGATVEAEFDVTEIPELPASIDEDDNANKIFAGYMFDLPAVDLGVELGYVNFGEPEIDTDLGEITLEPAGINLWGIASLDAGLFDVYGKLGYINWDVDYSLLGETASDDGSDLGYGVGLSFGLGPVDIRGEYEVYDIEDADVSMLSLGLVYRF